MVIYFKISRFRWSISRHFHNPACSWPHMGHRMSQEEVKKLEAHWRAHVLKSDQNVPATSSKKYVLSMFPYPSGNLHMGHVRVYTISDCIARYYALLGHKVTHPMGWDAFGLPAENAAIERQQDPKEWTRTNIEIMRQQLLQLGCRFDWEREVSTCDPSYYRWTQVIFVKLYQAGLAYQKESYVNWDPVDRTVLAQEQIDENGRSWRSGAIVEKKPLRQWFIRATRFTKDLLDGLEDLGHWGDIVDIQRNWLGECDVYKFWLPLERMDGTGHWDDIDVLLKDPTALSRATFLAIRPTHILNQPGYVRNESENAGIGKEKVLTISAQNPLNGQRLPIVVSTDVEFDGDAVDVYVGVLDRPSDQDLVTRLNLPAVEQTRMDSSNSLDSVISHAQTNGWGGYATSSKLGDWVVSRQRYWGTPIPIIHCQNCETVPVPERDLPVVLPEYFPRIDPSSTGYRSPLAAASDWCRVECPRCGGQAERETDTLDTFFDSSWYFLRYLDWQNTTMPFDRNVVEPMMPVDMYVGGKEHATLHLYYARVISHFLHALEWNPVKEPFHQLLPQGMVMGKAYAIGSTGQYIPKERVKFMEDESLVDSVTGQQVVETWEKMSKSKHNGVNPLEVLDTYGIDMTRLLVTSVASPRSDRNWDLSAHKGLQHWLDRVKWVVSTYIEQRTQTDRMELAQEFVDNESDLKDQYNETVRKVSYYIGQVYLLNTAITRLTMFTSTLRKCSPGMIGQSEEYERSVHALIIMLSIFAPHFAAETWSALSTVPLISKCSAWRKDEPVWRQEWPKFDHDAAFDLEIYIQGEQHGKIPMDHCLMDKLNAEEAFELAKPSEVMLNAARSFQNFAPASITHIPNYGAQLYLHANKKKRKIRNA